MTSSIHIIRVLELLKGVHAYQYSTKKGTYGAPNSAHALIILFLKIESYFLSLLILWPLIIRILKEILYIFCYQLIVFFDKKNISSVF